jgi:mitochondrial fission protein ELM1
MISEAAISGKPIYVYHLPHKRKSIRISNFHKEFNKLGITRKINNIHSLEKWTYNSLNESERIGNIIKKRIIEENI